MPQNIKLDFKPQTAGSAAPPILERIMEQYKYFRGVEIKENRYYTKFNTVGELVSLVGLCDSEYRRILLPQRTADGFIFDFVEEQPSESIGGRKYSLAITPFYSSSTGRINRINYSVSGRQLKTEDCKILYATTAEVIGQYLVRSISGG
ncbi:MAG: hypothetical protein AABX05_01545 [Nanoarchaeota archaeon]